MLRRMKQQEAGEDYVIRIIIVFTAGVKLFGRLSQGGRNGRGMRRGWGRRGMCLRFWWGNIKKRYILEYSSTNGRIIIKLILKEQGRRACTEFMWFRIGTSWQTVVKLIINVGISQNVRKPLGKPSLKFREAIVAFLLIFTHSSFISFWQP